MEAHLIWPLPNCWLGTSAEDQASADERIPHLFRCPAAVRFLSLEPLLGPIDLDFWGVRFQGVRPDWVIVGGESGPGARPMHPNWVRSIRDQCYSWAVPFFFKQWGEHDWLGQRVGKKAAGRELDGVTHDAMPAQKAAP